MFYEHRTIAAVAFAFLALSGLVAGAAPVPTAISPTSGLTTGRTSLSISGSGFTTVGTTRVTFDGEDATRVAVFSAGYSVLYINCTTPPHAAGVVDVVVINPDGQSGTLQQAFTYITHSIVPSVRDLPETNAQYAISLAGLTVGAVTMVHCETVPADTVISEDPSAGTPAEVGSVVNLVVSAGPPLTVISIASIEDLQKIGKDPAYPLYGSYMLTTDIDASGTATWNGGAGFEPIGNSDSHFLGAFDGQGHVISGLTINPSNGGDIGLFGYVDAYGQVKNVGLEGCAVTGPGVGPYLTGGLVGKNDGVVTGSYVTGTVTGLGKLGGLVGDNYGKVVRCHATVAVSGEGGGLIGYNKGTVIQCYATGAISGSSDGIHSGEIGGLIGGSAWHSDVRQCYATGAVTGSGGDELVGGLLGYSDGAGVGECYATGRVSASGSSYNPGGLVGYAYGSDVLSIYASYWDTKTSGQWHSDGGTGKTTVAMMTQATFVGWDFQNVWAIDEGKSYPYFQEIPLQVDLAANMCTGRPPLTVAFTYSASVPQNEIVDWRWDFGDGTLLEGNYPNPTHVYTESGKYSVSLSVTTLADNATVTKQNLIAVNQVLGMGATAQWLITALIVCAGGAVLLRKRMFKAIRSVL